MIESKTIPEKLYVGVQTRVPFSTVDYPLAFATPYGTDAAFEKRKATVLGWIQKQICHEWIYNPDGTAQKDDKGHHLSKKIDKGPYDPEIIDNVPVAGFALDKVISRWTTSNKWFRIQDPRGFTVEISAANLAEILIEGAVIQGVIQGKYVWARDKQINYLIHETHKDYQDSLKPKVIQDLEIGDIIDTASHDNLLFVGIFYQKKWYYESNPKYYSYGGGYWKVAGGYTNPNQPRYIHYLKDVDRVYLYQRVSPYGTEWITTSSKPKKFEIKSRGNTIPEIPLDTKLEGHYSMRANNFWLYKTKEDMKAKILDLEVIKAEYAAKRNGQNANDAAAGNARGCTFSWNQ